MSLVDDLRAIVEARPGRFAVYARNLTTGETVGYDEHAVLPIESAAKTFILVHYARLVAEGTCDPTVRMPLADEHRLWGTGVLRYLSAGLAPTRDDLAWLMIIVSDNVATRLLMESCGLIQDDVNGAMAELGLETAQLNPEITVETAMAGASFATSSARDLAEVYTHLDDRCRTMLLRQQNLIGLPRRLPHAADASDVGITMPVRVYNKTGTGIGRCVDSGLFETDSRAWIVAAIATDQPDFASRPDDVGPSTFGEIGEMLYKAWGADDAAS
jgi:beta-lactamase class A